MLLLQKKGSSGLHVQPAQRSSAYNVRVPIAGSVSRARSHTCWASPPPAQQPATSQQQSTGSYSTATASLVCVSLLWGSYGPSVSWLLHSEHSLPPSFLTALRTVISAAVMLAIVGVDNQRRQQHQQQQQPPQQLLEEDEQPSTSGRGGEQENVPLLARTFRGVIPSGVELGLWNFIGTALSVTGLAFTSPTRAGFLIQLTAVCTPIMAALAGQSIPPRTVVAAMIALAGTCMIALDSAPSAITDASLVTDGGGNLGDLLFVSACLFFSLATVRLSYHAPAHAGAPIQLATSKKVTLGALSLAWLIFSPQSSSFTTDWGEALGQQTSLEWLLIITSSLGPGALAAFLQTYGQARVPATMAQVIYSLTPLWSALIAWIFLGDDDGLGPLGWTGGGIILAASLLATTGGDQEDLRAKEQLKKP